MNANDRGTRFVASSFLFALLGIVATIVAVCLVDSIGRRALLHSRIGEPASFDDGIMWMILSLLSLALAVAAFLVARRNWLLYAEREMENRKMSSEMLMTKTEESVLASAGIAGSLEGETVELPPREMLSWMADKAFERYQSGSNGKTAIAWLEHALDSEDASSQQRDEPAGADEPIGGYVVELDKEGDVMSIALYRI